MQKADKFYKEYLGQEWDIDIKIGRINCGTLISKISRCPISFILSVPYLGNGLSLPLVLKRSGGSIILCAGIAGMDPESG